MDTLSIVLGIIAALGSAGTVAYYLDTHNSSVSSKRQAEIDARLEHHLHPISTDLADIHVKLEHMNVQQAASQKAAIIEALEPVKEQLTALNTKVDPLWTTLVQNAMHNADVLHHPHPERAELDELLDHFKEDTLTREEERRLRRFLNLIKNWEPGVDIGFPVYESEPSAAANLLGTLDLVRVYRERLK